MNKLIQTFFYILIMAIQLEYLTQNKQSNKCLKDEDMVVNDSKYI